MRIIIIISLLFCNSINAEWIQYHYKTLWYDDERVSFEESYVYIWTRIQFRNKGSSRLVYSKINCEEYTHQTLNYTNYNGTNWVWVLGENDKPSEIKYIKLNSHHETLANIFCVQVK